MNTNQPTIQINNLTKNFGRQTAVSDLSLEVFPGEVFALLGANGSGKTTTIRCLLNIYQPTSGSALINGQAFDYSIAQKLGYLPEERGLYAGARVLETLIYFGQIKGLDHQTAQTRATEYLERVELGNKSNAEIKQLSSGQQQKLQLGITIINQPQILILDEPTKGLDPVNRGLLMELLNELNKAGSTVIFITHQMEEVEKIADRLVMIKNGKRVLYGKVEQVKAEFGTNTIHLNYSGKFPANESLYQSRASQNSAEIIPKANVSNQQILQSLLDQGLNIQKFEISTPSLHEIFLQISKNNEPK